MIFFVLANLKRFDPACLEVNTCNTSNFPRSSRSSTQRTNPLLYSTCKIGAPLCARRSRTRTGPGRLDGERYIAAESDLAATLCELSAQFSGPDGIFLVLVPEPPAALLTSVVTSASDPDFLAGGIVVVTAVGALITGSGGTGCRPVVPGSISTPASPTPSSPVVPDVDIAAPSATAATAAVADPGDAASTNLQQPASVAHPL